MKTYSEELKAVIEAVNGCDAHKTNSVVIAVRQHETLAQLAEICRNMNVGIGPAFTQDQLEAINTELVKLDELKLNLR